MNQSCALMFYSTVEEWFSVLSNIIQTHSIDFAIDEPHNLPHCPVYSVIDEAVKHRILSSARRIFLFGAEFSKAPPTLRKQSFGLNSGKYFIDETRGGPSIQMIMGAHFEECGLSWFGQSSLAVREAYWNDAQTSSRKPTNELVSSFRAIRGAVLTQMRGLILNGKKIWVSDGVWSLFMNAKAGLPSAGKCFTVQGESAPPTPWRYGK